MENQLRNANEDPPPLAQLRIGIFLCDECDEEWNDPNCQGNSSNRQECCNEDCRADVYPDQLLRKVGNKVPSPQHLIERRIGKFQCSSCQLEWKSSECQRNDPNRQKCRRKGCRAKVYPDQLLLTPYQGTRRGYGLYECREHDPPHKWSSAYSWANAFQECERCNDIVYPHEQRPLIGSSNRGDPNHNVRLCGKCQELGHPCNKGRQQQQQQQQNQPRRR